MSNGAFTGEGSYKAPLEEVGMVEVFLSSHFCTLIAAAEYTLTPPFAYWHQAEHILLYIVLFKMISIQLNKYISTSLCPLATWSEMADVLFSQCNLRCKRKPQKFCFYVKRNRCAIEVELKPEEKVIFNMIQMMRKLKVAASCFLISPITHSELSLIEDFIWGFYVE